MTTSFAPVGFAPTEKPSNPKIGTPPINPNYPNDNSTQLLREYVAAVKNNSPLLANIIATPVGCDLPEQGGISGNCGNKLPEPPIVCYMA